MTASAPRRALKAVAGIEAQAPISFCGHCGARPDPRSGARTRVCVACELGLILHAPPESAPAPDQAFLVVASSLEVCALSDRAEQLLGVTETEAVPRHLGQFLAPAEERAGDYAKLMEAIPRRVAGEAQKDRLVRAAHPSGACLRVRTGSCGPPPAALLVFDHA